MMTLRVAAMAFGLWRFCHPVLAVQCRVWLAVLKLVKYQFSGMQLVSYTECCGACVSILTLLLEVSVALLLMLLLLSLF